METIRQPGTAGDSGAGTNANKRFLLVRAEIQKLRSLYKNLSWLRWLKTRVSVTCNGGSNIPSCLSWDGTMSTTVGTTYTYSDGRNKARL